MVTVYLGAESDAVHPDGRHTMLSPGPGGAGSPRRLSPPDLGSLPAFLQVYPLPMSPDELAGKSVVLPAFQMTEASL